MMKKPTPCLMIVVVTLAATPAHAATVFSHTFDGGTDSLNGTPVDVGAGSWMAASVVNRNGDFSTGSGSATLAFTPSNGFVYYLEASIINITGDGNWIAMGFANGQSVDANSTSRFINGRVVGTAWMLVRGDNTANSNTSFLGLGTFGTGLNTNHGLTVQNSWPTFNNNGGDIDLRIVLDTTGGSGNWNVSWLAKLASDFDYLPMSPTADVLTKRTSRLLALASQTTRSLAQSKASR